MLPQVRAAALTNYIEVARFVGLDPHEMLRRAKISPALLADPENLLATAAVVALLEDSARESGCIGFGLLLAESRSVASVGAVGLLLRHQRTARGVIEAVVKYQGLMAEAIAVGIEDSGETTIIRTDVLGGAGRRQAVELLMGTTCRVVSEVVGGRWRPDCAYFVHDAPDDLGIHRRIFQSRLAFRSEYNGFSCSAASLDAPNPLAESVLAGHAERYLDMLVPDPADGSISERARRSIYLLMPAGHATLDRVGDNLGLHPRALQRLLDKEGRTFATLLNEVRRELALRYLSSAAHSVTAVAQMTGYASPSSFTRWFCAEFGVAPAAWRAEEREAQAGAAPSPAPITTPR